MKTIISDSRRILKFTLKLTQINKHLDQFLETDIQHWNTKHESTELRQINDATGNT